MSLENDITALDHFFGLRFRWIQLEVTLSVHIQRYEDACLSFVKI